MVEPDITYLIALDPQKQPGQKPLLGLLASWPDRGPYFLLQSRPGMPDQWQDQYRLWRDIRDGFADLSVEEVDASTFKALCDRQGIELPTLEDWQALRSSRTAHHIPIVRRESAGRDQAGPSLA
jgi:hypothetical protein